MQKGHWTDEQFLERLYGLVEEDAHVRSCPTCQQRWEQLLQRRKQWLHRAPAFPEEWWYEQRQRIFHRLEQKPLVSWLHNWAPSLASVALVILAVVLLRQPTTPPTVAVEEAGFFTEVYTLVESPEPVAVQPIYALFED